MSDIGDQIERGGDGPEWGSRTREEIDRMADPDKTTLTDLFYNGHVFDVDHPLFDGLVSAEPFSSVVWINTIRRVKKQRDEARDLLKRLFDAARDANIWLFQAPPGEMNDRAKVACELNRVLIEVNAELDDSIKAMQEYIAKCSSESNAPPPTE